MEEYLKQCRPLIVEVADIIYDVVEAKRSGLEVRPQRRSLSKDRITRLPEAKGIHSVITIVELRNKYLRIQCTLSETLSVLGANSPK